MNMIKKNGGFTLVELIVVIAILAILAGIAVPAYSGYIKKANEAVDNTMLDAVKTAAVFVAVEKDNDVVVSSIEVTADGAVTVNGTIACNVESYCGDIEFKSDKYSTTGAKWTSTGWAPLS